MSTSRILPDPDARTVREPLPPADLEGVSEDLMLLALLHEREPTAELITELRHAPPEDWFNLSLAGPAFEEARTHMLEGLAVIGDPPSRSTLDLLAADYAAIYLTFHYRAAPTESVWRDEDGLERQDAMFEVRRVYARHRLQVADWRLRSDDHLVSELMFLAALLQSRDDAVCREAAIFLRDHMLVWVPLFAARVASRCQLQFFAGTSLLTAVYLHTLGDLLASATGTDMTPPELKFAKASVGAQPTIDCGGKRTSPPRRSP